MSVSSCSDVLGSYPHSRPIEELPPMHQRVVFSKVDELAEQVETKYKVTAEDFYTKICNRNAQERLRTELDLNTRLFDARKILKVTARATGLGLVIGFLVVGTRLVTVERSGRSIKQDLKILAGGTAALGVIGAGIGVGLGYRLAKKEGRVKIFRSNQFNEWKAGLHKEQYDLFLSSLKNYANIKDEDTVFDDYVCYITHQIPDIPVMSPNGHVYEKEAIEEHLDRAWAKIERYREDGYSEEMLQEQMETICPLRGGPFRKEDLKYAIDFTTHIIRELKRLKSQLEVNPERDHILQEGIEQLLDHYRRTYRSVTAQVVARLTEELIHLGATDMQREAVIAAFDAHICQLDKRCC